MEQSTTKQPRGPGMIPPAAKTPANELCAVIDKHRFSALVMTTPLGRVLPLVEAWVTDVERRMANHAEALTALHEGRELHPAVWETLQLEARRR